MTTGTAVTAGADTFMSCQVAVASVCVGIGLMPSTVGAAADPEEALPPMLMPAMLEPPAAALEELVAVFSALAQPATTTTLRPASPARRTVRNRGVRMFMSHLLKPRPNV